MLRTLYEKVSNRKDGLTTRLLLLVGVAAVKSAIAQVVGIDTHTHTRTAIDHSKAAIDLISG